MNILTDQLPDTVEINGIEYKINTDYRAALRVMLAFEDDTLTSYEKQIVLLSLYDVMPDDIDIAYQKITLYLNGGKVSNDEQPGPRVYSFSKDAEFIFSAFRQTHNIDLERAQLHWWKFLALFMDLGQDTTFCQLVGLRKRIKTGKATKEERQAAREMGEMIDIPEPDTRSLEEREKEAEFLRLVGAK
jgi:hypothetical protein